VSDDFHVELTESQVASFRDNGFLALDRITTDEEIEWLRTVYDELFAVHAGESTGLFFDLAGRRGSGERKGLPQILAPEKQRPELLDTIYARNARRLGAQLLGVAEDELVKDAFMGHMIFKPAQYGKETPWHQDDAYRVAHMTHNAVSSWMPLDDASVDSGCMQFLPGSHNLGVVPHYHLDHDPLVHALVAADVDATSAVSCPLRPGGVSFHHSRTLHYAAPNTTAAPRRAYIQIMTAPARPNGSAVTEFPWQAEEREALASIGEGVPDELLAK
jgi:ectoine hydroxylase-related dioxygenase (phytanoyl-CoA dioxygenase family)